LLILTLDLVAGSILTIGFGQSNARRSQAFVLTMFAAGIAGAAIASNHDAPLPGALLLLMIPVFRAGEVWGRVAAVVAVAMSIVVAFIAAWTRGNLTIDYIVPAASDGPRWPSSWASWARGPRSYS